MAKRSKKIVCFSLCSLILCMNFITARAEALPEIMSGSTTLADNIMTYYALSGTAVANTDWINTLYNSYGSSFGTIEELAQQGYLVLNDSGFWEPVQELGQIIEQAPAYSSLGLNDMFNISAQEAAAGGGFAAASGGSILAGSLGSVASTGVVPLLGGVTAAYWGGIALGTLIAHGLGLYGEKIADGQPITFNDQQFSQIVGSMSSYATAEFKNNNNVQVNGLTDDSRVIWLGYYSGSKLVTYLYIFNKNRPNETVLLEQIIRYENGTSNVNTQNFTLNSKGVKSTGIGGSGYFKSANPSLMFPSQAAYNSYVTSFQNGGVYPTIKSPDLIGENGNLEGENNNGNITVPDMKPQIDPGTQAGKPLTLQDWLNFANAVQNNNNQVSPSGTPDNTSLFENILDLIRTVIPENIPNPNPNPNPDPYSPPVVTPVPDPSYPDPVPDQELTENPQESENPQQTENPIDTGKPWRLPDLKNKFPFCIPWDIAKVFSKLKVNSRQAPHISWRFNPPNTPIDYTFNLDLEDFEEVATLLRTLELMGFIVGLAFATRYLIGAN